MLGITIPAAKPVELWDEVNERFIDSKPTFIGEMLQLEHSLVSMSKWESMTGKPFLSRKTKTPEETLEYIKCMTVCPVMDLDCYNYLSSENYKQITEYIDAKMTATTFREIPGQGTRGNGEFVTAEIIYYWMVALEVPDSYQYWHLNKLMALIKVINLKKAPPKKMNHQEQMAQQRSLNEQRLAEMHTNG